MDRLTESEKTILERTRKHIRNEKELINRLEDPKLKPLNEKTLQAWVSENLKIEEQIRELLGDSGPMEIQDPLVYEQLKKIRDKKTKTYEYIRENIFRPQFETALLDATNDFISRNKSENLLFEDVVFSKLLETEVTKKFLNLKSSEEQEQYSEETLDEMIEYFQTMAGYSGDFIERKKAFGTLLVERPLPPQIGIFLSFTQDFFLLNQFAAVIGFSRILLEIACQHIFDQMPQKYKKLHHMDGEIGAKRKIREVCKYRLVEYLGKIKRDAEEFGDSAADKYGEASDILHGKIPTPKSEQDALIFVKDIFSIIEALYENKR